MSYQPEFKGPIEGWVVNHMTKNYWRVAKTMPREDLLQEAYVVFLRCKRNYANKGVVTTPQHFMALFKTAWTNEFTSLSVADTNSRFIVADTTDYGDGAVTLDSMGETDNDGSLAIMVRQAPREVLMVLNLFLSAPQELIDLALGSWNINDRRGKAGSSKRVCQMLGLPEDLDVLKMTEEYFSHR
jgi:hypothetical protein